MNQSLITTNAKTTVTNAFSKTGALSIGGIAIGEIAILGAAGYVLWKNKEQIQKLLEKGGVQVPSIMKADMNELVATGAAFLAKSKRALSEEVSEVTNNASNSSSSNTSFNTASKPATTSTQFANKDNQALKKSSSTIHDA